MKIKLKQIHVQVNIELSTKNTEYSHIPWNNFLYPPMLLS